MTKDGEVQVSQSAGLFSSPKALSTEIFITYVPLGTNTPLAPLPLPMVVIPSHAKAKNPELVLLRGR